MKNFNMCYIGVTEEKIENLKKKGKMRISVLILIYTIHFAVFACLKVYTKFHNPKSSNTKTLCLLCFKFSATWPLSRNK